MFFLCISLVFYEKTKKGIQFAELIKNSGKIGHVIAAQMKKSLLEKMFSGLLIPIPVRIG